MTASSIKSKIEKRQADTIRGFVSGYGGRLRFSDRLKTFGPSMHEDRPRWIAFLSIFGQDATGEGHTKDEATTVAAMSLPEQYRKHFI
jgi:hypothetical protein